MESLPEWSSDLNMVAFAYDNMDEGCDIGTANSDGSGFKHLPAGFLCYSYPSWSRKSSRMAIAVIEYSGIWIAVMDPEQSGLRLLALTQVFSKTSWSPDDAYIAFASGTASSRKLMWIRSDGTESGTIVTNGWAPDWRPR
jgi:Tol biopolymer transport system component